MKKSKRFCGLLAACVSMSLMAANVQALAEPYAPEAFATGHSDAFFQMMRTVMDTDDYLLVNANYVNVGKEQPESWVSAATVITEKHIYNFWSEQFYQDEAGSYVLSGTPVSYFVRNDSMLYFGNPVRLMLYAEPDYDFSQIEAFKGAEIVDETERRMTEIPNYKFESEKEAAYYSEGKHLWYIYAPVKERTDEYIPWYYQALSAAREMPELDSSLWIMFMDSVYGAPAAFSLCNGDVNADTVTDVKDAVLLSRVVAEDPELALSAAGRINADLDNDGAYTIDDLTLLLAKISGK